jgi:hypothetical protein
MFDDDKDGGGRVVVSLQRCPRLRMPARWRNLPLSGALDGGADERLSPRKTDEVQSQNNWIKTNP